jgi:hypothetical protein
MDIRAVEVAMLDLLDHQVVVAVAVVQLCCNSTMKSLL